MYKNFNKKSYSLVFILMVSVSTLPLLGSQLALNSSNNKQTNIGLMGISLATASFICIARYVHEAIKFNKVEQDSKKNFEEFKNARSPAEILIINGVEKNLTRWDFEWKSQIFTNSSKIGLFADEEVLHFLEDWEPKFEKLCYQKDTPSIFQNTFVYPMHNKTKNILYKFIILSELITKTKELLGALKKKMRLVEEGCTIVLYHLIIQLIFLKIYFLLLT